MLNYLMTLAQCKMSKKGALFVEYALILAFVVIVGTVLVSSDKTGIAGSINAIFDSVTKLLGTAKDAKVVSGS